MEFPPWTIRSSITTHEKVCGRSKQPEAHDFSRVYFTNKVSDKVMKNQSYEDDFQAIYETDHDITVDEAEALMQKSYFFFLCTTSSYKLDGNTMTIDYTIDRCN